jgi:YidC/Oxa1 family membrane protein insertase
VDQLFKSIAWLLAQLYAISGSYGVAIVLLTLVVMAITTPLTLKGTKSMIQMQRLQPELKKIQERHRDDRETMNRELMAFYKANNINPVGGCLPMIIQMPVFIILYRVLNGLTRRETNIGRQIGATTAQLRDAIPPGLVDQPRRNFNPGYISDTSELYKSLAQTDQMRSWGIDLADSASSALSRSVGHALPYLVLILIVAVTGVIQQRQIQGRSSGATVNSQQQAIMKIMPFFLPIFSFGLSAGLVVYFVVSNLWRVGQQAFITRTLYAHLRNPDLVDTTAVAVAAVAPGEPATERTPKSSATKVAPSPAPAAMGRNRRDPGASQPRTRIPAKPKAVTPTPATSGRVTPPASKGATKPAKSKKKRK